MRYRFSLFLILVVSLMFFFGCAAFQLRGEIQSGRNELLWGSPKKALAHFQRAAEINPHYVTDFTEFEQGVWTYVGRAHYKLGEIEKAQEALNRALREHPKDPLAQTCLAAVLLRQGDRQKGMTQAQTGLVSLRDWLRYMDRYKPDGHYWDPGMKLENNIDELLAMIEAKDVSAKELISGLEWLGREFEQEIDRVKEDKRDDSDDDNEDTQQ